LRVAEHDEVWQLDRALRADRLAAAIVLAKIWSGHHRLALHQRQRSRPTGSQAVTTTRAKVRVDFGKE
jgi:hypothetical protein